MVVRNNLTAYQQGESPSGENERMLTNLIANIPGVIYRCAWGEDRTVEYISDAIADISGHPASDFIDNQHRSFTSIIHPDDRDKVAYIMHRRVAQKQPYLLSYRVVHREGSIRWVCEKGQGIFSN